MCSSSLARQRSSWATHSDSYQHARAALCHMDSGDAMRDLDASRYTDEHTYANGYANPGVQPHDRLGEPPIHHFVGNW